ncbi:MAG: hypothetical protein MI865_01400, partial [Proteobacteria bacterium]|nr:hypothetical protein [Pseudomonadota bacterium]
MQLTWWKKSGIVLSVLLILEGSERLFDLIFGDGDGEILSFHISYYVSFLQLLILIFLVNWLLFPYQNVLHEIKISIILTGVYLVPLVLFEIIFHMSLLKIPGFGFLKDSAKQYYFNNRPLIQFDDECAKYESGLFYLLRP